MRGTDLSDDVDVRITLVHELTHALQDQHFDLTKLDEQVETSGQDFALTALVEGDATWRGGRLPVLAPRGRAGCVLRRGPRRHRARSPRRSVVGRHPTRPRPLHQRPLHLRLALRRRAARRRRSGSSRPRVRGTCRAARRRSSIRLQRATCAGRSGSPHRSSPPTRCATVDADDFGALSLYLVLASQARPRGRASSGRGVGRRPLRRLHPT